MSGIEVSDAAAVRLGIIGCGRIVEVVHLPALAATAGIRVVGVAEPDDERRTRALRAVPMATPYADYQTLLAEPDIEAVLVSVPTPLHAEVARAAFAAGKHVYLEKPLAATLDEGRRIAEAARAAGTVGMLGFAFRFSPQYERLRELLADGALGAVAGATAVQTSSPRALPAWKQSRRTGGGVLLDLASHHIDLARHLFDDEVAAVGASTRSLRSEADTATLRLDMASGLQVDLFCSLAAGQTLRTAVYGADGRVVVEPWQRGRVAVEAGGPALADRVRAAVDAVLYRPDYHAPFRRAFAAFARAVRDGGAAGASLSDGLANLAVIEAAERSARSGRTEAVEAGEAVEEGAAAGAA